jgi:hypothetical protein
MVPAEFMTTAVAMLANAAPEFLYFSNKLLTCHLFKVGIHNIAPSQQGLQRSAPCVWMTQPPNVKVRGLRAFAQSLSTDGLA